MINDTMHFDYLVNTINTPSDKRTTGQQFLAEMLALMEEPNPDHVRVAIDLAIAKETK